MIQITKIKNRNSDQRNLYHVVQGIIHSRTHHEVVVVVVSDDGVYISLKRRNAHRNIETYNRNITQKITTSKRVLSFFAH